MVVQKKGGKRASEDCRSESGGGLEKRAISCLCNPRISAGTIFQNQNIKFRVNFVNGSATAWLPHVFRFLFSLTHRRQHEALEITLFVSPQYICEFTRSIYCSSSPFVSFFSPSFSPFFSALFSSFFSPSTPSSNSARPIDALLSTNA